MTRQGFKPVNLYVTLKNYNNLTINFYCANELL